MEDIIYTNKVMIYALGVGLTLLELFLLVLAYCFLCFGPACKIRCPFPCRLNKSKLCKNNENTETGPIIREIFPGHAKNVNCARDQYLRAGCADSPCTLLCSTSSDVACCIESQESPDDVCCTSFSIEDSCCPAPTQTICEPTCVQTCCEPKPEPCCPVVHVEACCPPCPEPPPVVAKIIELPCPPAKPPTPPCPVKPPVPIITCVQTPCPCPVKPPVPTITCVQTPCPPRPTEPPCPPPTTVRFAPATKCAPIETTPKQKPTTSMVTYCSVKPTAKPPAGVDSDLSGIEFRPAAGKCCDTLLRDRSCLEDELNNRDMLLLCQRERMLLEQKLHHREQLMWDHEQFRTQQLSKREAQFRYKVQEMAVEQDMHNRDAQIRNDRDSMFWERDMYQQDQMVARTRQQLVLQRDLMYDQGDEASKRRMQAYNLCFNKPLDCGPDLGFIPPQLNCKEICKKVSKYRIGAGGTQGKEDGQYFRNMKLSKSERNKNSESKLKTKHKHKWNVESRNRDKYRSKSKRCKSQEKASYDCKHSSSIASDRSKSFESSETSVLDKATSYPKCPNVETPNKFGDVNTHQNRMHANQQIVYRADAKCNKPEYIRATKPKFEHKERIRIADKPNICNICMKPRACQCSDRNKPLMHAAEKMNVHRKCDNLEPFLHSMNEPQRLTEHSRPRRVPVTVEPIRITSSPHLCDCECHFDSALSHHRDFCDFCDCNRLPMQSHRTSPMPQARRQCQPRTYDQRGNEYYHETTVNRSAEPAHYPVVDRKIGQVQTSYRQVYQNQNYQNYKMDQPNTRDTPPTYFTKCCSKCCGEFDHICDR